MKSLGQHKVGIRSMSSSSVALALIALISVLCLSSCTQEPKKLPPPHYTLQQLLLKHGGRLSRHAGRVEIVLPSRMVFVTHSARMRHQNEAVLNEIASYLGPYSKGNVYITSYYSTRHFSKKDLVSAHSVAEKRAKLVGQYLISNGTDSRLTVSMACVNGKGIKDTCRSRQYHYRNDIVINFKFLSEEII
jgi:hypothetical protein